jgi:hypothetical protein
MKMLCSTIGGLFAIAAAVSAPSSARATPFGPAAIAPKARSSVIDQARHRGIYDPGVRCIRAPCYVPRRPWYAHGHFRPHYAGLRVVCQIRSGYYGPRQVCYRLLF